MTPDFSARDCVPKSRMRIGDKKLTRHRAARGVAVQSLMVVGLACFYTVMYTSVLGESTKRKRPERQNTLKGL